MKSKMSKIDLVFVGVGILFALLWSSAAVVIKIALQTAQPFVISTLRFFLAGLIMLFISHMIMKNRLPKNQEWKQLAIYGLLNIAIYLSMFIIAMRNVSPGLGIVAVATNPIIVTIFSAVWDRKKIAALTILALVLSTTGVIIAAYPLLQKSYATPKGLIILFSSMLVYSAGILYFERNKWNELHTLTINGWQTLFGGFFVLPFMLWDWDQKANVFGTKFWSTVVWLVVIVSIFAVQLFIFLLKNYGGRTSNWLFLCPIFGFISSNIMMHEPLTVFTAIGVAMVLTGLYIVIRNKGKEVPLRD